MGTGSHLDVQSQFIAAGDPTRWVHQIDMAGLAQVCCGRGGFRIKCALHQERAQVSPARNARNSVDIFQCKVEIGEPTRLNGGFCHWARTLTRIPVIKRFSAVGRGG